MPVEFPSPRTNADFGKRLAVTLAILFVYKMGTLIPLPLPQTTSLFLLSTTAPNNAYIFSLGVSSFFQVLIALELAKFAFPALARWNAASARNAARLQRYILAAALALTAFQAFLLAGRLGQLTAGETYIAVLTCVAGTALVGWLMIQITVRGLGNGFWILAAATIASDLRGVVALNLKIAQDVSAQPITIAIGFVIGAVTLLVFVDLPWQENNVRQSPANAFGTSSALAMTVWPPTLAQFAFSEFLLVVQFFNDQVLFQHRLLMEVVWGGMTAALILLFSAFYHMDIKSSSNGAAKPVWTTALAQAAVWLGTCIMAIAMVKAGLSPFYLPLSKIVILIAVAVHLLRSPVSSATVQMPR
jgi:preprotein translocase subunit SecY